MPCRTIKEEDAGRAQKKLKGFRGHSTSSFIVMIIVVSNYATISTTVSMESRSCISLIKSAICTLAITRSVTASHVSGISKQLSIHFFFLRFATAKLIQIFQIHSAAVLILFPGAKLRPCCAVYLRSLILFEKIYCFFPRVKAGIVCKSGSAGPYTVVIGNNRI